MNDVARIERPLDIPFCEKCQRQVDSFETRTPAVHDIDPFTGYARMVHTGEIVVTIRCHGETWQAAGRFTPSA